MTIPLPGASTMVQIQNSAFVPANLTINAGDMVVWIQIDSTSHTSTSGQPGIPNGLWDSGLLSSGQSFSHTFTTAGSFPYYCTIHPFMTGSITVQGAQGTLTSVAISSPANNAQFAGGTNISIQATASTSSGTINKVEFFDGATLLGTDTTSPFAFIATNLSAGTHSLTAKATDSTGASATSPAVVIVVTSAGIGGGTRITNAIPARIAKGDFTIELKTILDNLVSPLGLAAPDDGSGRLFVFDQIGLIHVVTNETRLPAPLLDVRSRLAPLDPKYDERGLLGVALHTNFAQHPFIYTYTSEPNGPMADFMIMMSGGKTNNHQSVIAEWRIDTANSNRVDLTSRREIMRIDKPQANHNGGALHFGPDGFLYVSIGDGGAADDQGDGHSPGGNGQDKSNILGKVIRIDINARTSLNRQYGVPADNPFIGQAGALPEIYAFGLRNPYSFSFDRQSGQLYLADVGQNDVEEVDIITKGGNFGWPIKEGTFFFNPNGTNEGFVVDLPQQSVPANLVEPIAQYDHDEGAAIIGGYVYRGGAIPSLSGRYLTGDWGRFQTPASGRLFYIDNSQMKELRIGTTDRALGLYLKGFGQDAAGELYVFGSTNLGPAGTVGKMLKIVPAGAPGGLTITRIAREGNSATITWSGGQPPYIVQRKTAAFETNWMNLLTTSNTTATIVLEGTPGFLRVADQAKITVTPFTAILNGAAERPNAVTTAGSGLGTFSLEGSNLTYSISFSGLSGPASAAHIHGPSAASATASPLIPFNVASTNAGRIIGSTNLTADRIALLKNGMLYANIHTAANPGGEIRGQIASPHFIAILNGASERPNPVTTSATGTGLFQLVGDQLSYTVTYSGLSVAATAGHIHGPASTNSAASVLIPFSNVTGTSGTVSGTAKLTPDQLAALVDGLTYANIHTSTNPGGEIRGQIVPAP